MDISSWLNDSVRFFVVIAKSSFSNSPIGRLFSPNVTSTELTRLDPYTAYDVSVTAVDGDGSPFKSTVLQARTDEWGKSTQSSCVPNKKKQNLVLFAKMRIFSKCFGLLYTRRIKEIKHRVYAKSERQG